MSLDMTERDRQAHVVSDRMAGWVRRASKQKIIGLVLIFDTMTLIGCGLWSAMAFLPARIGGDGTAFLLVGTVTGLTV